MASTRKATTAEYVAPLESFSTLEAFDKMKASGALVLAGHDES
jgi:hypothetical protein